MNEVRLELSDVEKVLDILAKGSTGETGELFFKIRQTAQMQMKEFQDKELEEKIAERLKESKKDK